MCRPVSGRSRAPRSRRRLEPYTALWVAAALHGRPVFDAQGRIVFNEVNTIPGFTAHSRYPSMMKAAGLSLQEILTAVIELAVEP